MDRAQLENALQSAQAMRMQMPEGSPAWQACVDKEMEIRRKLAMPEPSRSDLGGAQGPRAAGPNGMVDVNPGYLDDSGNPARGHPGYQENHEGIDSRYLDNRGAIGSPGHYRSENVATGGGGEAVSEEPPPPPRPSPSGTDVNLAGQPSVSEEPPATPRRPLFRFNNAGEVVAWGGAALALGVGLWQGYKKMKGK